MKWLFTRLWFFLPLILLIVALIGILRKPTMPGNQKNGWSKWQPVSYQDVRLFYTNAQPGNWYIRRSTNDFVEFGRK